MITNYKLNTPITNNVEKIILPYVDKLRYGYDLPLRQAALCIVDVYKAHRGVAAQTQ